MSKRPVITARDIINSPVGHLNSHLKQYEEKRPKTGKYKNERPVVDGINFDSKREASRYLELKMLERAGDIKDLMLQVPFQLNEEGKFSYKYVADFVYFDVKSGQRVVEDCKGAKTKTYNKKKKLMLNIYGIEIKET